MTRDERSRVDNVNRTCVAIVYFFRSFVYFRPNVYSSVKFPLSSVDPSFSGTASVAAD